MLLDLSTFTGNEQFHSKFIRVGNEVYITNPDDLTTLHAQLAEMHKVLERIYDWKTGNKDEVDGGEIFVQGKVIRIGAHSLRRRLSGNDRSGVAWNGDGRSGLVQG
jgi:hypothetical protein